MQYQSKECIFCGCPADSEEHVIPDWVQRDHELKTQKLTLPNYSGLHYRHTKIPACAKHNQIFGGIENRIKIGKATKDEIYLWAYKVHIGLLVMDTNLRIDIRNPNSGTMLDSDLFKHDLQEFRQLFAIWQTNNYKFTPSPLGSIFRFKPLSNGFDFVHSLPGQCVGISLGNTYLAVFLRDLGHASRAGLAKLWNPKQFHLPNHLEGFTTTENEENQRQFMVQRVWLCETAYWVFRLDMPSLSMSTSNTIIHPLWKQRPYLRKADTEEYKLFCASFGLKLTDSNAEMNFYELLPNTVASIRQLYGYLDA